MTTIFIFTFNIFLARVTSTEGTPLDCTLPKKENRKTKQDRHLIKGKLDFKNLRWVGGALLIAR